MKKKTVIPLFLALLCAFAFSLAGCKNKEPVGSVSGAEDEVLTVGGEEYELCPDALFHASDRGEKIGEIKSGDRTFHVYSVKGTDRYLYCRWEHEGRMYKLAEG